MNRLLVYGNLGLGPRLYNFVTGAIYRKVFWRDRKECANFISRGSMVLDVGAGKALFAKALEERCGARVICLDLVDQRQADVGLVIYDGLNFPFSNNEFDVVIFSFVLHHCVDQDILIEEAKRVSRGKVIVLEDDAAGRIGRIYTHLHEIVYSWQYNVKSPFLFRSQAQWSDFFEAHGLDICHQSRKWTSDAWYYHVRKLMFVLQPVRSETGGC